MFPRPLIGLLAIMFFLLPAPLFAASVSGGVPNNLIWFSKEPFFDGDQISFFTPLYNSSSYRFEGTVTLSDGKVTIGTQSFNLDPGGSSAVYAFPWKATEGDHAFSVIILNGKFFASDKSPIDLPISGGTANVTKRFVDYKQGTPVAASRVTSTAENILPEGANITQYLSTKIPTSMLGEVLPIVGSVEEFRANQVLRANNMEGALQSGLTADPISPGSTNGWKVFESGVTSGDVIHTPWEYVKLLFALCYQFLTTNVYAFYLTISLIAYKIIRIVVRIFS